MYLKSIIPCVSPHCQISNFSNHNLLQPFLLVIFTGGVAAEADNCILLEIMIIVIVWIPGRFLPAQKVQNHKSSCILNEILHENHVTEWRFSRYEWRYEFRYERLAGTQFAKKCLCDRKKGFWEYESRHVILCTRYRESKGQRTHHGGGMQILRRQSIQ